MIKICAIILILIAAAAIGWLSHWFLSKKYGKEERGYLLIKNATYIAIGVVLVWVGYVCFYQARHKYEDINKQILYKEFLDQDLILEFLSQALVAVAAAFPTLAIISFVFGNTEHRELLALLPKAWKLGNTKVTFLEKGWDIPHIDPEFPDLKHINDFICKTERIRVLCYFLGDDPMSSLFRDGNAQNPRPLLRKIKVKWAQGNNFLIAARSEAIAASNEATTVAQEQSRIGDSYKAFEGLLRKFEGDNGLSPGIIKLDPRPIKNHDATLSFSLICFDEDAAVVIPPHHGTWEDAPKFWLKAVKGAKSEVIHDLLDYSEKII